MNATDELISDLSKQIEVAIAKLVEERAGLEQRIQVIDRHIARLRVAASGKPEAPKPTVLIDATTVIDDTELPYAAANALMNGGISTIGELLERTPADLLLVKNLGRKRVRQIAGYLGNFGLSLRDEREDSSASREECPNCHGSGRLRLPYHAESETCFRCSGAGYVARKVGHAPG